jgi:uncharacterized protein
VRALVLADTHLRQGRNRRLPDVVYEELDRADVILHAGDFVGLELLDELRGFAPVRAVLGNNDHALVGRLPETEVLTLAGVPVAMIHDSGARIGREGRMARRFPGARVVVFGHSHAPENRAGLDGQWLFNPGSPTDRRAQPCHTYGVLELDGGELVSHTIVSIEPSSP